MASMNTAGATMRDRQRGVTAAATAEASQRVRERVCARIVRDCSAGRIPNASATAAFRSPTVGPAPSIATTFDARSCTSFSFMATCVVGRGARSAGRASRLRPCKLNYTAMGASVRHGRACAAVCVKCVLAVCSSSPAEVAPTCSAYSEIRSRSVHTTSCCGRKRGDVPLRRCARCHGSARGVCARLPGLARTVVR